MRFSLVGRELVHDIADVHLAANSVAALVAVVACDKPPVGTVAAVLENDTPAVILSDGPIRPGIDPVTGDRIDLVRFSRWSPGPGSARFVLNACGQGSCGGCSPQHHADLHSLFWASSRCTWWPRSATPRRLTSSRPDRRLPPGHDEPGIRSPYTVTPASLRRHDRRHRHGDRPARCCIRRLRRHRPVGRRHELGDFNQLPGARRCWSTCGRSGTSPWWTWTRRVACRSL
jgi:hypothetical protein